MAHASDLLFAFGVLVGVVAGGAVGYYAGRRARRWF